MPNEKELLKLSLVVENIRNLYGYLMTVLFVKKYYVRRIRAQITCSAICQIMLYNEYSLLSS